jgi:hypothetical protein
MGDRLCIMQLSCTLPYPRFSASVELILGKRLYAVEPVSRMVSTTQTPGNTLVLL